MISISIVSHKQNALVNRLLASLAACESLSECEILITEDVRDSVEIDEEAVGVPIKRIVNHTSQGFARNQNQAFQHASGDYFCILNPDVRWVEPVFLTLLDKISSGVCDIAAPLVVDSMGRPQDSFRNMPSPKTLFLRRILRQHPQLPQFERGDFVYPDWIAGTFMLLTAEVFRQLGGFDNRYRMYFEDVDFCSRATLAGYRIGVDTNVRIFHVGRFQSRGLNKFLLWHLQSSARFFGSRVYRDIRIFMDQDETSVTKRKPIGEVAKNIQRKNIKIILSANTDWYLYNFRLPLVNQLQSLGAELILVSPPGQYAERLLDMGFDWRAIRMSRRGMIPTVEIKSMCDYCRLYRLERPDLVHHFTLKPILYGSIAAKLCKSIAVVNAVTGLGYLYANQKWGIARLREGLNPVLRWALRLKRHKVIFQHEGDQNIFLSRRIIPSEDAIIIPSSGVDLQRFSPHPEKMGMPVIMIASRMLRDKGILDLVSAARILNSGGVKARVVLVGSSDDGNPSSIPSNQLKAWDGVDGIEWWGYYDKKEMPRIYTEANIVVLPSYHEGVPKMLIEAAAMGKPIIATDLPGCREVVTQEVNGLLVPRNDPVSLANAIARLVENPGLCHEMGLRSREIAVEKFAVEKVNRQTIQVYKELLGPTWLS